MEEALLNMDSFDADAADGQEVNSMDSGDLLEKQFNEIKGAFDD